MKTYAAQRREEHANCVACEEDRIVSKPIAELNDDERVKLVSSGTLLRARGGYIDEHPSEFPTI
jgi:hypothetical protein